MFLATTPAATTDPTKMTGTLGTPAAMSAEHATTTATTAAAVRAIEDAAVTIGGDDGTRTHDPLLAKQVL